MKGRFHFNLTVDQLTPSDQQRELWFFPDENDVEFTYPGHVLDEGEVKIGTRADIQLAYQQEKGRPDLVAWLKLQKKEHPGEKALLVTVTIDEEKVVYAFSANYRSGNSYVFPTE